MKTLFIHIRGPVLSCLLIIASITSGCASQNGEAEKGRVLQSCESQTEEKTINQVTGVRDPRDDVSEQTKSPPKTIAKERQGVARVESTKVAGTIVEEFHFKASPKSEFGAKRTWTSEDGAFRLNGRLMGAQNSCVTISDEAEKSLDVEISRLSKSDQEFVARFLEAERTRIAEFNSRVPEIRVITATTEAEWDEFLSSNRASTRVLFACSVCPYPIVKTYLDYFITRDRDDGTMFVVAVPELPKFTREFRDQVSKRMDKLVILKAEFDFFETYRFEVEPAIIVWKKGAKSPDKPRDYESFDNPFKPGSMSEDDKRKLEFEYVEKTIRDARK